MGIKINLTDSTSVSAWWSRRSSAADVLSSITSCADCREDLPVSVAPISVFEARLRRPECMGLNHPTYELSRWGRPGSCDFCLSLTSFGTALMLTLALYAIEVR